MILNSEHIVSFPCFHHRAFTIHWKRECLYRQGNAHSRWKRMPSPTNYRIKVIFICVHCYTFLSNSIFLTYTLRVHLPCLRHRALLIEGNLFSRNIIKVYLFPLSIKQHDLDKLIVIFYFSILNIHFKHSQ